MGRRGARVMGEVWEIPCMTPQDWGVEGKEGLLREARDRAGGPEGPLPAAPCLAVVTPIAPRVTAWPPPLGLSQQIMQNLEPSPGFLAAPASLSPQFPGKWPGDRTA